MRRRVHSAFHVQIQPRRRVELVSEPSMANAKMPPTPPQMVLNDAVPPPDQFLTAVGIPDQYGEQ